MSQPRRLVVFTGDLNYTVRRNIVDLDARMPGLTWLVLVHTPPKQLSKRLKSLRFNVRKHGLRWITYQLGEVWEQLRSTRPSEPVHQSPGAEYELEAVAARGNVRILCVADIHAETTLLRVREFEPDLGLSLAAPILKQVLFGLPQLGTINLHKGRLPGFRGMPPAFWELWTDQKEVGCSVHWVNERLDEGDVLAESAVARERFSTQRGLQLSLDEVGSELVCDVAQALLSGRALAGYQPAGEGKTWRKPTLAQQGILRDRLRAQGPDRKPWPKRAIKDQLSRWRFTWHCWVGWRLTQPRITVLLYHRVSDQVRDNLTVGVEQFERQMRLLRQHCQLMSIDDVLATEQVPRSRRPLVAVTFDDGYLDNFAYAAPVLRRHRVPCAFFVSTGLVGTQQRFPHDIRRGNSYIPTMTWKQLRAMRAWGFTIGSHTVSHVDCVSEPESLVRTELRQSRDDLQRELGELSTLFAYPYGGRHQMNDQRLALVRDAGYEACLAAYGGSNVNKVNRWSVLRRGIHWEFSDDGFLLQCLGR